MLGRERPRPEAQRSALSGHRHSEQLGKLDQFLAGAAPGRLIADAHQRVLRFDEHARCSDDVVLVRTNAHRHIELRLGPDVGGGLLAQRVGRKRQEYRAARRGRRELHPTAQRFRDRGREKENDEKHQDRPEGHEQGGQPEAAHFTVGDPRGKSHDHSSRKIR